MIVVIFQTEVTFDEKAGNKSSYGHKKSKLKNPLLRSRSPKHEGGGGGGFVSNGVIGGKVKIINLNNGFLYVLHVAHWQISSTIRVAKVSITELEV